MSKDAVTNTSFDWKRAARMTPFRSVAVLGAGTMGSQIAAHFANAGIPVLLLDLADDSGVNKNAIVEGGFKRMASIKPDPLFTAQTADIIRIGNFDDHFHEISGADWVIEAVVEQRDIKLALMERLETVVGESTVVSSNTSGIPIADLGVGRSEAFRKRLLGTHFFNPPRYLPLLEVIPTPYTDWDVVERVSSFARIHLGKGVVIAKDSPYFIGNRIGIFALLSSMKGFIRGDYSIEEIDALTGTLVGRPKSATFRTADVVGLDVMKAVIENLYDAIPGDESREEFQCPETLLRLVEAGLLGAKTRAGFYSKIGKEIHSVNPESLEYAAPDPINLPALQEIRRTGGLEERLKALFDSASRSGAFFRESMLATMAYAARRIPEIADSPADIDKAIRWGFGWRMGPFEIWDSLGFSTVCAAMDAAKIVVPQWVSQLLEGGGTSIYQADSGVSKVFIPFLNQLEKLVEPEDEIGPPFFEQHADTVLDANEDVALSDMGDGIVLLEFKSKANTLGAHVIAGIQQAIDMIETDDNLRGLVIGNEGSNFSVGANLGELATALLARELGAVDLAVRQFQDAIQRVRYSSKPVVVAVHQMALGGACELILAASGVVAAAESYIGLVELGAGLIPAGTGSTRLAELAADASPNGYDNEIQALLALLFQQVAMATVSTSARHAQQLRYLRPHAIICMRPERRFSLAKKEVLRLSEAGYLPPAPGKKFTVLGAPGRAALEVMAYQFHQGKYISDYDFYLTQRLATAMTGGDLNGPTEVPEQYMLNLEREIFLSLLGEERTQERIRHILEHNKPLRN